MILVEACVTSVAEAIAAEVAGADRLEYCIDLSVGGCSPEAASVNELVAAVSLPVVVMVRPRAGDFVYTAEEVETMVAETAQFREAGAHGIATGALLADDMADRQTMQRLIEAAAPLPVTFHRAIDRVWEAHPDQLAATVADLADLGIRRLLTGGGTGAAQAGAKVLRDLVTCASGRITLIAAGAVRADHVVDLVRTTGVKEVHARASAIPALVEALRCV